MNVGQRVMVIATWLEIDCIPPRIGSVGTITVGLDRHGDYEVSIDGYPWPFDPVGDPDWICPSWALMPIDDVQQPRELCTADTAPEKQP